MKKIIIVLSMLFIILNTIDAQYKTFEFGKFSYETDCFYNKGGFITIKIQMSSLDLNKVELMIGSKEEYNSFIKRLNLYKTKMIELDSICIKNNIIKTDKMIDFNVKNKETPTIWFGNYFNSSQLLSAYAWCDNKSIIIVHTGVISSLMNEYITCKGGVIIFSSPKDIQEMLDYFDLNKICNYIDNKNKVNNLLK